MFKKISVLFLLLFLLFVLSGCDQLYLKDYEASGVVKDGSGAGIEKVKINFSDGTSVLTSSNGTWKQTGLKGDIKITPQKDSYTFDPSTHHLSQLNENKDNIIFIAEINQESDDSDIQEENKFDLSGEVINESGKGIEGVTIYFSGEFSSVKTNAAGEWKKEGLNSEVNVEPSKYGYTFEPSNLAASAEDQNIDFTAIKEEVKYTATGTITDDADNPVPGVTLNFSEENESVTTGSDGNWEKTGLVGEVTVTPELDDWQFVPANKTVDSTNNKANFTAKPADDFEYYTLSGIIQNTGGEYIYIEIRRENGTLIADAVTDDEGNWTASNVWGTVVITPQARGVVINEFIPESKIRSGADENVDFIAE